VAVQRFRSVEEMNRAPLPAQSGQDVGRFFRHCARYWAIAPAIYPRGVRRFRSIEDAQRDRQAVRTRSDAAGDGSIQTFTKA
jgi:hypothetical protein